MMSVKIESSIEEVKNWITEDDVFDLLSSFEIIEEDDFRFAEDEITISFNEQVEKSDMNTNKSPKVSLVFNSEKNNSNGYSRHFVEAA
ncbi:hypothetical protein [Enterococcus sp. AZ007]|uniref:hypothetical protein n=1 Tax=Enterococcus sp. AZ007 TaxID=2774839 RepID=UPI003F273F85